MITPNIWGQGQLFTFSALDGDSFYSNDFVGTLCGDKIGIRFHSKIKRELVLTGFKGFVPEFEIVTSDVITIKTPDGEMNIVYADTGLIIGNVISSVTPVVLTEGEFVAENDGESKIQNSSDGDFTALLISGEKFSFAFGHSVEEVLKKANNGINLSIEETKEKRLDLFKKYSLDNSKYDRLYAKCMSIMKSQLYSPEGKYTRIWSTPDRLPHKYLWLWDSVYHAIGHRNINTSLAQDLILDIFESQREDGFIPHLASPDIASNVTQPPVIGWGSYLVYQKSNDKEFLKTVFENNAKFLEWCHENRRENKGVLYNWLTTNDVVCRCDECGMDNSPRFDKLTVLEAIDFSCFMANETRYMAKIADVLGRDDEKEYYINWYNRIKEGINDKLWCEEDGFYFDYDIYDKKLHKVWSVASFLPLFAGICNEEKAKHLVTQLLNPETFNSPFPVPSISKQDSTYGSDMWRGPVWLNYNYLIISGLKEYEFNELAAEIKSKTLNVVNQWYLTNGTVYEFYDPENISSPKDLNRKGAPLKPYNFDLRYQSIRDYGWTATLTFDMLSND